MKVQNVQDCEDNEASRTDHENGSWRYKACMCIM